MLRSLSAVSARLTVVAFVVASALLTPHVARADYPETFCQNSAAPPWVQGAIGLSGFPAIVDLCQGASSYQLGINSATMAYGQNLATQLEAPPGLAFTHISLDWTNQPETSGPEAFVGFGYGSATIATPELGTTATPGVLDAALPDASNFWAYLYCSESQQSNCSFAGPQGLLQLGTVTVTLHDTGTPSVSATGGGLSNGATVSGTQAVLFDATDTGSGVAKVTVALGSTVVGTATSTCEQPALAPCPATVNGSISADTTQVPDGTYPVILTAYDVSGDATPVQVATVNVLNHPAPVTTTPTRVAPTTTTTSKPRKGARQLKIQIDFAWKPLAHATRLVRIAIPTSVPRKARITFTCIGAGCPFRTVRTDGHHVARLIRKLHRRRFGNRDKLVFVATATPPQGRTRSADHAPGPCPQDDPEPVRRPHRQAREDAPSRAPQTPQARLRSGPLRRDRRRGSRARRRARRAADGSRARRSPA